MPLRHRLEWYVQRLLGRAYSGPAPDYTGTWVEFCLFVPSHGVTKASMVLRDSL